MYYYSCYFLVWGVRLTVAFFVATEWIVFDQLIIVLDFYSFSIKNLIYILFFSHNLHHQYAHIYMK